MKIKRTEDNFLSIWFLLSLGMHAIILACLFLCLVHKPSLFIKKQPLSHTFAVPAPVIFYGHTVDPLKKPGSLTATKTKQIQSSEQKKIDTHQTTNPTLSKKSEKRKQKDITLQDVFNHARKTFAENPHIGDLQVNGDAAGQSIVIKEGDMKYYSLWTTFLHHLNTTARFNRVQKPVPIAEWVKTKKIKQNMQCGITINKKGEVQGIDVTISSGYPEFDQLCIKDVWSASPFPPLPDQLGKTIARFEVKSYL